MVQMLKHVSLGALVGVGLALVLSIAEGVLQGISTGWLNLEEVTSESRWSGVRRRIMVMFAFFAAPIGIVSGAVAGLVTFLHRKRRNRAAEANLSASLAE